MKVPARALASLLAATLAAEPPANGFHSICQYDQKLCDEYDSILGQLDRGSVTNASTLAALDDEFVSFARHLDAFALDRSAKWPNGGREMLPVWADYRGLKARIADTTISLVPKEAAAISTELGEEEDAADRLIQEVSTPEKPVPLKDAQARLQEIDSRAARTWSTLRALGQSVDRTGHPVDDDTHKLAFTGTAWKDLLNPLETRTAALRDRLKIISDRIGAPSAAPQTAPSMNVEGIEKRIAAGGLTATAFGTKRLEDVPEAAPSRSAGAPGIPFSLSLSPKTLLDMKTPPAISKPNLPTEIVGGKVKVLEDGTVWNEDAHPGETAVVRIMKKIGLTKTYGDPAGRSRYVFQQTGGTCGLASQAVMFAEIHQLAPDTSVLKGLEDQFFERARTQKMFDGNSASPSLREGTNFFGKTFAAGASAQEYLGDMLDVPVKKHFLASDRDLIRVVEQGKEVQVGVDAGDLWNDHDRYQGGHAIVVTGLEANRITGSVEGFYINDTGSNEGGRFVNARQFYQAWHHNGGTFIEAL